MDHLPTQTARAEARLRERAGGRVAMNQALKVGDSFLDYRIERVLDEGGMGIVYEAREAVSDDVVAIKCILPRHAARDDFLKRFDEECKVYPKLKHDNIVKMRRAGLAPGNVPFIVMDRLDGRTLRQLLSRFGCLNALNALHVMVQVADAMRFAHDKGVLHRDLKPENIMVGTKDDRKGHVWLLDFGIAKVEDGGLNTDELPAIGTARYLSSEQARELLRPAKSGRRLKPDGRADIYAFGVILYEVLTGKHPFIDDEEEPSFEEMLAGHLNAEPVPVHKLVPDCSSGLGDLVSKCIAKEPSARYATFAQVALAIRALLHALGPAIPANHPEARRRKQEEARSARQAAFEAMPLEEAEHVEAAGKVAQSVTAELRGFVPRESALPFAHQPSAVPEPAIVSQPASPPVVLRAVTEELLDFDSSESPLPFAQEPMSAPHETTHATTPVTTPVTTSAPDTRPSPGTRPSSGAPPLSSTMPLPGGEPWRSSAPPPEPVSPPALRGKGHTLKIPRTALPPAALPMEAARGADATTTARPPSAQTSGVQKTAPSITVTVSISSTHVLALIACVALAFALGCAALLIGLRAAPRSSSGDAMPAAAATSSATSATSAQEAASATSAQAAHSATSAQQVPSAPSAPTAQEAPSASSTPSAPTLAIPAASATVSPARSPSIIAAPPAAATTTPKPKPKRTAPTGPKPTFSSVDLAPLFEMPSAPQPKGRR